MIYKIRTAFKLISMFKKFVRSLRGKQESESVASLCKGFVDFQEAILQNPDPLTEEENEKLL